MIKAICICCQCVVSVLPELPFDHSVCECCNNSATPRTQQGKHKGKHKRKIKVNRIKSMTAKHFNPILNLRQFQIYIFLTLFKDASFFRIFSWVCWGWWVYFRNNYLFVLPIYFKWNTGETWGLLLGAFRKNILQI